MSESNENKSSKTSILKATTLNFLKPSAFNSTNTQESTNLFKNNPFAKITSSDDEKSPIKSGEENAKAKDNGEKTLEKKLEPTTNSLPKLSLFSNVSSTTSSSFVFGQNLHERVIGENVIAGNGQDSAASSGTGLLFSSSFSAVKTPDKEKSENSEASSSSSAPATSEAAKSSTEQSTASEQNGTTSTSSTTNNSTTDNQSLIEAARKYEEARGAQKRKYEEVETVTGEEAENNILDMNCKLFAFVDQNWEERGRGMFRLNDSKDRTYSRVVFRLSGSLRVLLNTKVWRDMVCDRASQKSLKFTAIDENGLIKIFLVMGRIDDIGVLHKTLSKRIETEKEKPVSAEEKKEKEVEAASSSSETSNSDEPSAKKSVVREEEEKTE